MGRGWQTGRGARSGTAGMSRRRRAGASPSASPARAAAADDDDGDDEGHPFRLRLELSDDLGQNPVRRTVCFFRSTSSAELGRAIAAAFSTPGTAPDEVAAVWELPDDADEALVHPLASVLAHPEFYTGRRFSVTAPQPPPAPLPPPPPQDDVEEEPATLAEVLAPLIPHPTRNPEMLLALALGAGALLAHAPSVPPGEAAPPALWRLTSASRALILLLVAVVAGGQVHAALGGEPGRQALGQLCTTLSDSSLQRRVGLGVGVVALLWLTRVFDTAARLAIVGGANCIVASSVALRAALRATTSLLWSEAQLQQLVLQAQKLFLPLLEMGDYAAKQLYLHGPPSPFLPHSLGFLDLPLDYGVEAAAKAEACQKLSPLRSSDFWQNNLGECSAFIDGKAAQFAASVRGLVVAVCALWALRNLPSAAMEALRSGLGAVPWRARVALPAVLLVLNMGIVLERGAEGVVQWLAVTEASAMLSLLGIGVLFCVGALLQRLDLVQSASGALQGVFS